MKSGLVWILVLSLAANGVLLAARWRAQSADAASENGPRVGTAQPKAPNDASDRSDAGPSVATSTGGVGRPRAVPPIWSRLDLTDLKSVVATLRASGMPAADVRTIVEALVRDRFKARLDAIEIGQTGRPYWQPRPINDDAIKRFTESRAVYREIESMTVDLLGPAPMDPIAVHNVRQEYGPISPEKLEALSRLNMDYSELSMQTRGGTLGPMMPWEKESLAFIEEERRRDLAALLDPSELETHDLYASELATTLRPELEGMAPTEAEYRALFAMQREMEASVGFDRRAFSLEASRAMEAARPKLRAQIKEYLGEERYRDYERAIDPGYQAALAVTKRLKLPPDHATASYALNQDIQKRVDALRNSGELSAADRSAASAALYDEANARLVELLTATGAEAYKARSGTWLRSLQPGRSQP